MKRCKCGRYVFHGSTVQYEEHGIEACIVDSVPMILYCPGCGERHIDKGEFATKPHHTHACQHCGVVWRPAITATVGVQFLPGFKDGET